MRTQQAEIADQIEWGTHNKQTSMLKKELEDQQAATKLTQADTRWQEKMTRAPKYYGCRNICEDISQNLPLYCDHHCYIIITVITIDTTSSPLHGPTVDGHQSATPPWSSSTSSTSSPLSPPLYHNHHWPHCQLTNSTTAAIGGAVNIHSQNKVNFM